MEEPTIEESTVTIKEHLDDCSICLENIIIEEHKNITTCNHIFHAKCMAKWILQNNSCPLCRTKFNVVVKDNTYIYTNFSATIATEFVYLSQEERQQFLRSSYEPDFTNLTFNHPVRELLYTIPRNGDLINNQYLNVELPPISNSNTNNDNNDNDDNDYTTNNDNDNDDNLDIYSFSLEPEESQSSGTENRSRFDDARLFITTNGFSLHPEDNRPSGIGNGSRINEQPRLAITFDNNLATIIQ